MARRPFACPERGATARHPDCHYPTILNSALPTDTASSCQVSYFGRIPASIPLIQVIDDGGVLQHEKTKIRGIELAASYMPPTGLRRAANFAVLEGRYDGGVVAPSRSDDAT